MVKRRRKARKERRSNLRDLSQRVESVRFEVFKDSDGLRVDQFLAEQLPWRSKTQIQDMIKEGEISVEGRDRVKKATRLRVGDGVVVQVPAPTEPIRHEELARALDFLYEDEDLVAVNKEPNLVVHPVSRVRYNTLIQALHWHYRHGPGFEEQPGVVPKICHRLDKDTSGIMVIAKNDPARRRLQEIFEARTVTKRYRALLWGPLDFDEKRVEAPLRMGPEGESGTKMLVVEGGLPCRSVFRRLREFDHGAEVVSLVEVTIETGRQHQIRAHAAHLGHPILCDTLYGLGEARLCYEGELILGRQALHSAYLSFPHPTHGEAVVLEAQLPQDMTRSLALLKAGAQFSKEDGVHESGTDGESAAGLDESL